MSAPAPRRWLALFALAVAGVAAHAPAAAADEEAQRQQAEQRIRLSANLLNDARMAQRVAGSGSAQAQSHLDEGRVHHALAVDLLAQGDVPGARRNADEALRHLGQARRLAPDAPARTAAARLRYEQVLASTERLIEAWRMRVAVMGRSDGPSLLAARAQVDDARQQAREGRFEDAARTLAAAEGQVLEGMGDVLPTRTLDYTPRFDNPKDEFEHELARHRSFAELLPLALKDLRPRPEAMALVERYGDTSQALHAQALQQQQAGDLAQALNHLRNATLYLQRALQAAGLVTPTATGTSP